MNRLLIEVPLQNEHTWSLALCGVVFDHSTLENTSHYIPGQNIFVGHLIVTMV